MIGAKTTIAERARRNKDGSVKTRAEGTKRTCRMCRRELDESNYYFHKAEGKYDTYCRECRREYQRNYKKEELERSQAKRDGKPIKRERNPFLYTAQELAFVKPDVMSVDHAKEVIREGADVCINKIYVDDHIRRHRSYNATVSKIHKNYVCFLYPNGSFEGFGWDDVIRILTGAGVEC